VFAPVAGLHTVIIPIPPVPAPLPAGGGGGGSRFASFAYPSIPSLRKDDDIILIVVAAAITFLEQ
jgi:predicted alternative tryptophan synthase beta-subunit